MAKFTFLLVILATLSVNILATKKIKSVTITLSKLEEISTLLRYPAKLASNQYSTMIAYQDGIVENFSIVLGQAVKKGQKLAEIHHTDQALNFRPYIIRAPISGNIGQLYVTNGNLLAKGQKIASIINPAEKIIKIEVTGNDLAYLVKGLLGNFIYKNKKYPIIIKGVSPFADAVTGTSTAEIEFINKKNNLRVGIQANVEFKTNIRQGIILPLEAVSYKAQAPFLKLAKNNLVEYRDVTLGQKRNGKVEIFQGLKSSEQVIIRSSGHIKKGSAVKVNNPPENKKAQIKSKKPAKKV